MLGDLIRELGNKNSVIGAEYDTGIEDTARSIAKSFDYEFRGVGRGSGPYGRYIIFLVRHTNVDVEAYQDSLKRLVNDGYTTRPISIGLQSGSMNCDMVLGKRYADSGGGVGVMQRPGYERIEIAVLGHNDSKTLLGIFTDTKPEHAGLVEELTDYFGMGQSAESQFPPAFRDFIRGLDI